MAKQSKARTMQTYRHARPHEYCDGYKTWRQDIINKPLVLEHPFKEAIDEWTITGVMLVTPSLTQPREIKLVETEEQLQELADELAWHDICTVDTEMDTRSYREIICTIQISTCEKDYVVDAIKLHALINTHLKGFFENPTKLKVFHGDSDLIPLQDNFDIFTLGFVDTQEVYEMIDKSVKNVSLKNLASKLLGNDIDKTNQLGDWYKRPLDQDMIKYAAEDTSILFQCWIKLKNAIPFFEHEPFHKSKISCKKTSGSRKQRTVESSWVSYMDSISKKAEIKKDLQAVFCIRGQYLLFKEIFQWRENLARENDIHPHVLLSPWKLQRITRNMPSNVKNIKKFCYPNQFLKMENYSELEKIINSHRPKMFEDLSLFQLLETQKVRVNLDNLKDSGVIISDNEATSDEDDQETYLVSTCVEKEESKQAEEKETSDIPSSSQNTNHSKGNMSNSANKKLSMTDKAVRLRRYRKNKKEKGKKSTQKIKPTSSKAKRTAAFLRGALKYQVSKEDILKYFHKLPKSLQ